MSLMRMNRFKDRRANNCLSPLGVAKFRCSRPPCASTVTCRSAYRISVVALGVVCLSPSTTHDVPDKRFVRRVLHRPQAA